MNETINYKMEISSEIRFCLFFFKHLESIQVMFKTCQKIKLSLKNLVLKLFSCQKSIMESNRMTEYHLEKAGVETINSYFMQK